MNLEKRHKIIVVGIILGFVALISIYLIFFKSVKAPKNEHLDVHSDPARQNIDSKYVSGNSKILPNSHTLEIKINENKGELQNIFNDNKQFFKSDYSLAKNADKRLPIDCSNKIEEIAESLNKINPNNGIKNYVKTSDKSHDKRIIRNMKNESAVNKLTPCEDQKTNKNFNLNELRKSCSNTLSSINNIDKSNYVNDIDNINDAEKNERSEFGRLIKIVDNHKVDVSKKEIKNGIETMDDMFLQKTRAIDQQDNQIIPPNFDSIRFNDKSIGGKYESNLDEKLEQYSINQNESRGYSLNQPDFYDTSNTKKENNCVKNIISNISNEAIQANCENHGKNLIDKTNKNIYTIIPISTKEKLNRKSIILNQAERRTVEQSKDNKTENNTLSPEEPITTDFPDNLTGGTNELETNTCDINKGDTIGQQNSGEKNNKILQHTQQKTVLATTNENNFINENKENLDNQKFDLQRVLPNEKKHIECKKNGKEKYNEKKLEENSSVVNDRTRKKMNVDDSLSLFGDKTLTSNRNMPRISIGNRRLSRSYSAYSKPTLTDSRDELKPQISSKYNIAYSSKNFIKDNIVTVSLRKSINNKAALHHLNAEKKWRV